MSLHEQFNAEAAWRGKTPEIQNGIDAQQALLGKFNFKNGENKEYMPFSAAVEFAKAHQPNLADRPKVISELRTRIASLCSDKFPVKYYTAVETPLDTYHHIDAFFEQNGHIATVDVSLREKDTQAQVLLVYSMDEQGQVTVEEKELAYVAQKIADLLNGNQLAKVA